MTQLCEVCYGAIGDQKPMVLAVVDPYDGQTRWRYWHREHAPAELKEEQR